MRRWIVLPGVLVLAVLVGIQLVPEMPPWFYLPARLSAEDRALLRQWAQER
jgi:hypothetical protein